MIVQVRQPLKNYSKTKKKKKPHVLELNISRISYLNCDMSLALVFTSSSGWGQCSTLSSPRVRRDCTDVPKTLWTKSSENKGGARAASSLPWLEESSGRCKVTWGGWQPSWWSRTPSRPRLRLICWYRSSRLCPSEMALSPARFELPFNAHFADLQTPALIQTDVDIIKRAGYFRLGWKRFYPLKGWRSLSSRMEWRSGRRLKCVLTAAVPLEAGPSVDETHQRSSGKRRQER